MADAILVCSACAMDGGACEMGDVGGDGVDDVLEDVRELCMGVSRSLIGLGVS